MYLLEYSYTAVTTSLTSSTVVLELMVNPAGEPPAAYVQMIPPSPFFVMSIKGAEPVYTYPIPPIISDEEEAFSPTLVPSNPDIEVIVALDEFMKDICNMNVWADILTLWRYFGVSTQSLHIRLSRFSFVAALQTYILPVTSSINRA